VERDTDGVLASPEDRQDSGKSVQHFVDTDYFLWELRQCRKDDVITLFLQLHWDILPFKLSYDVAVFCWSTCVKT
jgi:hypothetical protein